MIVNIDKDTICQVWKLNLWTETDNIRPVSSMTYSKEYNMNVYDFNFSKPYYIGYIINNEIIGVNSGHKITDTEYRSRGLWVHKKYRNQGIATLLLNTIVEQGKKENCYFIWSLPRKSALTVYERAGFIKTSDWINIGVDYGPNCYVKKYLTN